ncbi:MAG: DUF3800 domain-containing protein [bacterium]
MSPGLSCYIDEAGCPGFRFGQGSSDWLIISAVLVHEDEDFNILSVIGPYKERIKRTSLKPIHFQELSHEKRLPLSVAVGQHPLITITIACHKPSLTNPDSYRGNHRLYNYLIRYLLERVSWYARDSRCSEPVRITFSQRTMPYDELSENFVKMREATTSSNAGIEWSYIVPENFHIKQHAKLEGLIIADVVASSYYYAIEHRYGFTEPRYVWHMRRRIYRYEGKAYRYGLKIIPPPAEARFLDEFPIHRWASEYF